MEPYWAFQYGNPSSPHQRGVAAEKTLRSCRQLVADLLGARPTEIVFTGSGTESNNLALQGLARSARKPGHIITSAIEHPSVLEVVKHLESLGWEATYLPVSDHGEIEPSTVAQAIKDNTSFISLMMVNNELGTKFPISQVSQIIADANKTRPTRIFFHVDAIQALGKVPISLALSGIDLMSLSGHKIFGPKGVGALFVRRGTPIKPITFGGGQEHGLRSGTENVAGIVGFAKAAEIAQTEMQQNSEKLVKLRDNLIKGLIDQIPYSYLNGHPTYRLPDNVSVRYSFVEGESILLSLDILGIWASSGSACAAKTLQPSHSLMALGLQAEEAHGSLMLTLGRENTQEDVNMVNSVVPDIIKRLRDMSPLTPKELKN